MDELAIKFLVIGLALVLALFVAIGTLIYFCQRHRKRRTHLEKVGISNSGFNSPDLKLEGSEQKEGEVKNGFAQIFHGSPTMQKKTFEAPPPPTPTHDANNNSSKHNPKQLQQDEGDLRSVIVIDNYSTVNKNQIEQLTVEEEKGTHVLRVSPQGDKLTLKNRPFKINELPELLEEEVTGAEEQREKRENVLKDLPKDSPLNMRKFPNKMERLQENENEMLYYEFDILNQEAMTSLKPRSTIAELNENIRKNRFYDILPYDFNRVKLKNRPKSDYINASYINTDDGSLTYIAAQGPIGDLEAADGRRVNTVEDFWEMVWQENIENIVMLTQCVEGVRQKCAVYWPENAGESISVSENITIHLYCITEDEICLQRELWLQHGQQKRKILQWHYKEWRDAAGPHDAENLLSFMENIRAQTRTSERQKPLLVHCSAGVGRTGVYIALDILLQQLMRENLIDIFETVSKLRESRTSMVQNCEQYLTVYEVVALAIRRRSRTSG
uniref:protein-tyrosine-phosphatase n=1 Tax=Ditylenchus dipsaci TaxID=166011 RepID=A0A915DP85_9BILA